MKSLSLGVAAWALAAPAQADPCGMVPPRDIDAPLAATLTRTGVQYTYVFFDDGVEDVVLRPAFRGKVSEFGMLIPFKSPPAIRKVSDDVFGHLEAAVKPPSVAKSLWRSWPTPGGSRGGVSSPGGPTSGSPITPSAPTAPSGSGLAYNTVKVVSREAMGMYQVAVLEAGSPKALKRWMTTHGFAYPDGMEEVVQDYVAKRWCFVAVKARVGNKAGVSPRPGMRSVSAALPAGAVFTGAVQAMGFRFRTDTPVVPMRLSAHNPGKLHNRVFVLADEGVRFEQLDAAMVKRQIAGRTLVRQVAGALPANVTYWNSSGVRVTLRLGSGEAPDSLPNHLWNDYLTWAQEERDPGPVCGVARDLFYSDLLAAKTGRLLHHYEERHKLLLNVSEELGLRGAHLDPVLEQELAASRAKALAGMKQRLAKMTLTVIEGDFPREVLREADLTLLNYDVQYGRDRNTVSATAAPLRDDSDGAAAAHPAWPGDDPMRVFLNRRAAPDRRGQALVAALPKRRRAGDWTRLWRVLDNEREPDLVRVWALAAMGRMEPRKTTAMLVRSSAGLTRATPAWDWSNSQFREDNPELAGAVAGHLRTDIGERSPDLLIHLLLRSKHVQARRAAAQYLPDSSGTCSALERALAYDPVSARKRGVPWRGGALFLPSGAWSSGEAAGVLRELIHWQLYLERHSYRAGASADRTIARNNIFALNQRYRLLNGGGGGGNGASVAVAWSMKWAEGRTERAGDLLLHALKRGGSTRHLVVNELRRISGMDLGSDLSAWRAWFVALRAEEK